MESSNLLTQNDMHECYELLKDFFPKFLELTTQELKSYPVSQNVLVYYSYALQYNLQGGKLLRGTMLVCTVKALCSDMSESLLEQTLTVAWCVELLQTSFLVADDIMDQSTKRRSNTCWYLVPTIGVTNAINDVMFLYTMIYRILMRTLKDSNKLVNILETFNRVSMTTILGQHLDTYESKSDRIFQDPQEAVNLFSEICKNKTSYYSFFLPLKLGMLLGDVECNNLYYSRVEYVSVLIGTLFQAQDDYLDCYLDVETFGKSGTDIQTRKCTWLLSQALSMASEEQKDLIRKNIGQNDVTKVQVVKSVYDELGLKEMFEKYSKDAENKINREIEYIEHEGEFAKIKESRNKKRFKVDHGPYKKPIKMNVK